jgi:hypothetical protein
MQQARVAGDDGEARGMVAVQVPLRQRQRLLVAALRVL